MSKDGFGLTSKFQIQDLLFNIQYLIFESGSIIPLSNQH